MLLKKTIEFLTLVTKLEMPTNCAVYRVGPARGEAWGKISCMCTGCAHTPDSYS